MNHYDTSEEPLVKRVLKQTSGNEIKATMTGVMNYHAILLILGISIAGLANLAACRPLAGSGIGGSFPTQAEAFVALVEELDLEKAVQLYKTIAADSWSREERDTAEIRLAIIEWRIFDDPDGARDRLEQVSDKGPLKFQALLALASMQIDEGEFALAKDTAKTAIEEAITGTDLRTAQTVHAQAIVEEAVLSRLASADSATSPTRKGSNDEQLKAAQRTLIEIVESEPGLLAPAQLLLQASLLLNDGDRALEAWRAYYWLGPEDEADGDLAGPNAVLQELLPNWSAESAKVNERQELIEALAGSRFYTEAALVALDPSADTPLSEEASEIVAYVHFLQRLQEDLDTYYSKSLAEDFSGQPKALFDQEFEILCREINCPEGRGKKAQENYVRDRFGVMWEFGRTDYHDLYMGHTIFNEEQVIEQYGKSTTVRFQRLDHLVSHGIRSWIFDDLYFVGGYAQYDRIVEFRPFRVKLLMSLARKITDQEARERYADQVERDRKQDEKAAKEDPHAYLPGLNSRLVQRSLESLWHDVQQPGMTESQHQLSFLAELDDVWFEGPTLAHEGRHVIDFHRGSTNPVGLEFNAKLAETAFCRYPGIPLGYNILHPYGIGGHSEANKQIVAGYVSWMEEYASDINGLDLSKPMLPQLDLLSDDQLRQVAVELDTLAARQ